MTAVMNVIIDKTGQKRICLIICPFYQETVKKTWFNCGIFHLKGSTLDQVTDLLSPGALGKKFITILTNMDQAPVPLTRFRSNSKFDNIWQCSDFKCALPITTKFCTCHDSVTVVTCAKFRCDWLSIFQTRALPILIEFRIRSKYR